MKPSELTKNEYHSYYEPYIKILNDEGLVKMMLKTGADFEQFIETIPDEKLHYAYADEKWTVAEVILHIIDAERVFQYRSLRFARNDKTDLLGFEQNDYVPFSEANTRSKGSLLAEFTALRKSTVELFKNLTPKMLLREGKANGNAISVRAIGFIVSGHVKHHQKVLMERYL